MTFAMIKKGHHWPFKYLLIFTLKALILCCNSTAKATEITHFYDGDTVKIKDGAYEYKLRLTDIDAPERNQAYGLKSRRALIGFCKNTLVQVYLSGADSYKRKLGRLHCNNQDANQWMVENGHAWFNQRFSMDYTLDLAQQNAKQEKLGLWQSESALPPWQWRKIHPRNMLK